MKYGGQKTTEVSSFLLFFIFVVGSRDQTRLSSLYSKHCYPLTHLSTHAFMSAIHSEKGFKASSCFFVHCLCDTGSHYAILTGL